VTPEALFAAYFCLYGEGMGADRVLSVGLCAFCPQPYEWMMPIALQGR
jgi:hypothetical protein